MADAVLLHELIGTAAHRAPDAVAVTHAGASHAYEALARDVFAVASGLAGLGLGRTGRVAIYLDKRIETVVASFAAAAAGGVFVPLNPLLKPEQVGHVLPGLEVIGWSA